MGPTDDAFDPIAVLQALDRHRVTYIVVGALGRVIHGSGETTDGIDIVPSAREQNLRRLGLALEELRARRPDGRPLDLQHNLSREPSLELHTDGGELGSCSNRPAPAATTTSGARPAANPSGTACDPLSPRSPTTRACSPPSTVNRTASHSVGSAA